MPRERLMPSWLPPVNERIVNPVQRLWAPWLPPWVLVEHTGRKSGVVHRTPVLGFRGTGETLNVILFYGARTQWLRNLEAAGGGWVTRTGRRRAITGTRVVRDAATLPGAPALAVRGGLPVAVLSLGQRA